MMKELCSALTKFRSEFGAIIKGQTNPYFNSKYTGLPELLSQTGPSLDAAGLCLLQTIHNLDDGSPTVTTRLVHTETGQSIESEFAVCPEKKGAQGQGSAVTYARRYSITAMLGLPEFDDDANKAQYGDKGTKPAKDPFPKKDKVLYAATPAERRLIKAWFKERDITLQDVMIAFGKKHKFLEKTMDEIKELIFAIPAGNSNGTEGEATP